MNSTYRSLWNDSTGTFVAVPETARSAGKKTSSGVDVTGLGARFVLQALAVSVMLAFGANGLAQPTGGVVASGAATISTGATSTTITQSTPNAIINWQSFNIATGQSVQFVQPGSNSIALNRVLGADPSSILGTLSANGKVFLINPNGILFGQGASVNVGGLLASTLDLSNSDFLAGNYKFSGNGTGAVLNRGSLNADGGYVALLGANVSNQGTISAQLGSVVLAAGSVMTMDVAGDGLLNIAVTEGAVDALVQNGGLIRADGGRVLLTTQAAGSLLANSVNNTGVIQAQTLVTGKTGSIMLMGGMGTGTVNVGGTLDASAPIGGDGGFIETSAAHVKIENDARITTLSAQGKSGTWLIDPFDFTIGTAVGDDITPAALAIALASNVTINTATTGANTATDLYGTTAGAGDITVNNDVTWGAATTLTLNAVNDVIFNASVTATTGSLVATAGNDVIVNAMGGTGITMTTAGGNMTWTAGNDIWVKPGVVGGITATGTGPNKANITWTAGRDVKIDSAVTTTDANFTVCCGRDINVNAAVTTTRGDASLSAGRDITITADMTMTDGHVLLRAGPDATGVGGPLGGTVVFAPGVLYTVDGATPAISDITIDYTPDAYGDLLRDYSGNFTGTASTFLTTHMLVFAQGNDKVYDGDTDATLTLRGDPTVGGTRDVSLFPGTGTFDDKNVAQNIGITYAGYSLVGTNATEFALWGVCGAVAGSGRTSADITPAPLTLKANNATKVYGTTFTPANTAFTTPVAPVAGEIVTSVLETSTGSARTASVAGSTYPIVITPGSATGANGFVATNYTITYRNGALTVTPARLVLTANDATKAYGTTFTPAGTAFTQTGLRNSDTVTSVVETSIGSPPTASVAGSPYPIVITPGSATGSFKPTNYVISYVDGKLTVTPVPLTVTANDATKNYGKTLVLPDTAFTTTGLVNDDTVTSVPETSPGTVASAPVVGSPYAITPGTATGTYSPGNYTVTYVDGKLYVLPVVVPPVVTPPDIIVPPDVEVSPDVVVTPETPLELPIVNPTVGPRAWPPLVVLPLIPPQLTTLAPPVVLAPPPVPVVVTPPPERVEPVVQPVPPPYVAPIRPRKQDRN